MRKRLILGLPVILAAGMLIAPAGFAADKSGFTADEIYDPFGYMGEPVGEFVSAGTANCPSAIQCCRRVPQIAAPTFGVAY